MVKGLYMARWHLTRFNMNSPRSKYGRLQTSSRYSTSRLPSGVLKILSFEDRVTVEIAMLMFPSYGVSNRLDRSRIVSAST